MFRKPKKKDVGTPCKPASLSICCRNNCVLRILDMQKISKEEIADSGPEIA